MATLCPAPASKQAAPAECRGTPSCAPWVQKDLKPCKRILMPGFLRRPHRGGCRARRQSAIWCVIHAWDWEMGMKWSLCPVGPAVRRLPPIAQAEKSLGAGGEGQLPAAATSCSQPSQVQCPGSVGLQDSLLGEARPSAEALLPL